MYGTIISVGIETWKNYYLSHFNEYVFSFLQCNNPQTKEPKLDAAQRIAPEWKDYDEEIRNFQSRLKSQSNSFSNSNSQHKADLHDEF